MGSLPNTFQAAEPKSHPRILASHQPFDKRDAFAKAYPNGIPAYYKMCSSPSDAVIERYIEDNLPVGFYTKPPENAKAAFSTNNGQRPFRKMEHILPRRSLHLWSKDEIQSVCNSIRKTYWASMRQMVQPYCWDDLWTYFDAFDLYHYGAINLWNAINHLHDENKIIYADMRKECALEIGWWADGWVANNENRAKLKAWKEADGPIIVIMDDKDWKTLGSLTDDIIPLVSSALKGRRDWNPPTAGETSGTKIEARGLLASCRANGVENWLGTYYEIPMMKQRLTRRIAGQRVFKHNGLLSPPKAEPCGDSSATDPTPCVVHNGNHFYLPPGEKEKPKPAKPRRVSQAVLALHESVSAASAPKTTNVVVANGSNQPPPTTVASSTSPEKRQDSHGASVTSIKGGKCEGQKSPVPTSQAPRHASVSGITPEQGATPWSNEPRPTTAKSHTGSTTPSTTSSHRKTLSDSPQNV